MKIDGIDMDRIYTDQAMINDRYGDRNFFAAYTPFGIKQLDHAFSKRIQNLDEDPKKLAREISKCVHLHPVIKRNLRANLRARISKV